MLSTKFYQLLSAVRQVAQTTYSDPGQRSSLPTDVAWLQRFQVWAGR
jgi:hypothetical protein